MIRPRTAVIALGVVHFFGLLGMLLPWSRSWFEAATPFSLLLTAFLLLHFHRDRNTAFWIFAGLTSLAGYGVEVLGVQTQQIFGAYQYDTTLGFKVWDVPPMIGVNWLILVYSAGTVVSNLPWPVLVKSLLSAACMTALDLLIEPVAITHHYWHWENTQVPLQNYAAWFFVASVLCLFFYSMPFRKKNPLAGPVLVIQTLFFILLQSLGD